MDSMDWPTEWQERTHALRIALNQATGKAEKSRIIELLTEHHAELRRRRREGVVPPCFTPVTPEYAASRKTRRRVDLEIGLNRRELREAYKVAHRARVDARREAQQRVAEELAAIRFRATDRLMREPRAVEVGRPS